MGAVTFQRRAGVLEDPGTGDPCPSTQHSIQPDEGLPAVGFVS